MQVLGGLDFKSHPLVEVLDLMTLLLSVQNKYLTNFLKMKDLEEISLTTTILFFQFNLRIKGKLTTLMNLSQKRKINLVWVMDYSVVFLTMMTFLHKVLDKDFLLNFRVIYLVVIVMVWGHQRVFQPQR